MTVAAQGDVVQLVTAGAAVASAAWRGGEGLFIISAFSGAGFFQMQAPDGTWIGVKDYVTGTAIVVGTPANDGTYIFKLPACRIRVSVGGGAMNVYAIGV